MSMLNWVTVICLVFAIVSFGLFGYMILQRRTAQKPLSGEEKAGDIQLHGAIADTAKLIQAFAKLADSLEKAGPLALSLLSAIIFTVIAALSAGLGR